MPVTAWKSMVWTCAGGRVRAKAAAVSVNGVAISLSGRALMVFTELECLPEGAYRQTSTLESLCGSRSAVHNAIYRLKGKLAGAAATVGFAKGEGYRLENLPA